MIRASLRCSRGAAGIKGSGEVGEVERCPRQRKPRVTRGRRARADRQRHRSGRPCRRAGWPDERHGSCCRQAGGEGSTAAERLQADSPSARGGGMSARGPNLAGAGADRRSRGDVRCGLEDVAWPGPDSASTSSEMRSADQASERIERCGAGSDSRRQGTWCCRPAPLGTAPGPGGPVRARPTGSGATECPTLGLPWTTNTVDKCFA